MMEIVLKQRNLRSVDDLRWLNYSASAICEALEKPS